MRKLIIPAVSCVLALSMTGCAATKVGRYHVENDKPIVTQTEEVSHEPFVPSKDDVLAAREKALAGMSDEQIDTLTETVKKANLAMEHAYMYQDIFGELEDPNSFYWNYFDKTGEIQIGWAFDGGDLQTIADICAQENLTEDEFYEKYGTEVIAYNHSDAKHFIDVFEKLKSTVQDEALKEDLQILIDETQAAKETHKMEYANDVYKRLHDLDYFLLRFGLTEQYVQDCSTISKYYGTLSVYQNSANSQV